MTVQFVVRSTAVNSSDNLPSYPTANHHSSDDVYLREGDRTHACTQYDIGY